LRRTSFRHTAPLPGQRSLPKAPVPTASALSCAQQAWQHIWRANTTLPVIGIPMKGGAMDGMDALLATVQMPSGIPVATVALNGAKNAAWLAAEILALSDDALAEKLAAERTAMAAQIAAKEEKLQAEIAQL
jgi:5-(carboxyamino)imidazole ribonucleotide mutase